MTAAVRYTQQITVVNYRRAVSVINASPSTPSAPGSGSGDVVGPASAVTGRLAVFIGTTGKLIADGGAAIADLATAAQGDLADSAAQPADLASAISAHAGASDPHGDRAYTDGEVSAMAGATAAALATKLAAVPAGTAAEIVGATASGTTLQRLGYTIATLLAAARGRATHTGSQLANTISDFATAVQAMFGSTAGTICEGNDSRLSDARTPAAHTSSHQSGGTDAIKLDDLATPDDNTDLNATTSRHGLLPKLSGVATEYLDGTGAFSTPSGGGGSSNTRWIGAGE
ncbi:MAG: hypothetical protein KDI48_02050, partial [Xanthomonadales bacterium]|nr:hypothetical protein [Xanthomonadales bacterium]